MFPALVTRHLSYGDSLLLDIILALSTHLFYNRFEIDPVHLLPTFAILFIPPSIASLFLADHFSNVFVGTAASFVVFYLTLGSSIILYRISPVHPLANYPGPFLAEISKFWGVRLANSGKQHIRFRKLHEKYGDYVRIGPNEISCADASAIPHVLGTGGMPKGPLWDGRSAIKKVPALIAIRDIHEHDRRRKLWNRAFSTTAIKELEVSVKKRALQFVYALDKRCGIEVDLAMWFSFFTFDFMGDMAFGGGFELMRDGDKDGLWAMIENAAEVLAMMQNIPWATRTLARLPRAAENAIKFYKFSADQAAHRKLRGSSQARDLFYYLIDEEGFEKVPPSFDQVVSDGTLAIGAGADTTATVMSGILYNLLANPNWYTRLQDEIDQVFPPGEVDPFDSRKLAELPLLNAVINESLRMQPAVNTSLQRAPSKGSGGHWIGSHFLPEGTAINISPYVLHRDRRHFYPSPDKFWPERWMANANTNETENIVNDINAFIPFSAGPANCVGKSLALVEMRMVVALLVQRYEMTFTDEYDSRRWVEEIQDFLVAKTGKLPVILTRRGL